MTVADPKTFANSQAILKDIYGPVIKDNFNNDALCYKMATKSTLPISGKDYIFPVKTRRNPGSSFRSHTDPYPLAARTSHEQFHVTPKKIYARIQLEGFLMAASRDNKGAWVPAAGYETKEA